MQNQVRTSVVMPIYNEAKYIQAALQSLSNQDYPAEEMEWILVDGGSTDDSKALIQAFASAHPEHAIQVIDNPHKTVPYAMNLGIQAAKGEYIVRLDAHADYPSDYIRVAIEELEARPEVANVGGYAETKGKGSMGQAIAVMLSSSFGVGNSAFRTEGQSGYVDTVPFGVFRRQIFRDLGGYDTRLTRNQDNEMNERIRQGGWKIYLTPRMRFTYWCRNTLAGICQMARQNGRWNVRCLKLCPGTMGWRHFVPLIFLLSLFFWPALMIVGLFISWTLFGLALAALLLELALYFGLATWAAKKAISGQHIPLYRVIYLFFLFHLHYGWGSLMGIFDLPSLQTGEDKSKYAPCI